MRSTFMLGLHSHTIAPWWPPAVHGHMAHPPSSIHRMGAVALGSNIQAAKRKILLVSKGWKLAGWGSSFLETG